LQLGEELGLTLSADETKHFKLYKYTIEERIRPALQLLKLTARSAPQRTALHIALGLVMPRPEDKQLHALSKVLGFSYGNRSERLNNSQPFAADVAFKTRVLFDEARVLHFAFVEAARTRNFARLQQLLQPGAKVICGSDGTMAELVRFTAEGGCVLRFAYGDICEVSRQLSGHVRAVHACVFPHPHWSHQHVRYALMPSLLQRVRLCFAMPRSTVRSVRAK
jgi:hypothetical protein